MRGIRQNLSALFGSTGRPGISTFVSWSCAALAYPLATRGGYAGAVGAALVFSLSVLFLAYVLGSGTLAFAADAKRSCLPGSQRLARRANLLASVLLLPALVLTVAALAGNPVWPAWVPTVLVLAIAFAGILAARRPASAWDSSCSSCSLPVGRRAGGAITSRARSGSSRSLPRLSCSFLQLSCWR